MASIKGAWRARKARLGASRRGSAADVQRKARLVVGVAEALLRRPVRSALEIGCGEGSWRSALRRARPGIRYTGLDSSAYVVSRFGRARGIQFGTLGTLSRADVDGSFDMVICNGLPSAASASELARGLRALAGLLDGVAYLEVPSANVRARATGGNARSARHVAGLVRAFRRAGLRHLGMHCWVGESLRDSTAVLRRG